MTITDKTRIILGLVNGRECEVFLDTTTRPKNDGIFIDIAFFEGDRKSIPTRMNQISFDSNKDRDEKIRTQIIIDFHKKKREEEAAKKTGKDKK
ncbi:MAG: hypothetical protein WC564_01375 [Patescibacteria group bacterium]